MLHNEEWKVVQVLKADVQGPPALRTQPKSVGESVRSRLCMSESPQLKKYKTQKYFYRIVKVVLSLL